MSPGKRGQWGEDVLRHRWTLGVKAMREAREEGLV